MTYDVVVIGGGAAGEAAGATAAEVGGRVAVIERELVGGECAFWACMPSKTLLDSAARHALGGGYEWSWASARRDWMISREGVPYPDDRGHVVALEEAGAEVVRGTARLTGRGRLEVSGADGSRVLEARAVVVATGSVPVVPPVEGLADAGFWTSRDATALRELPSSVLVMGGGPVGVEMAQVYARFGVRTTVVEGNDRILARDHPRSSEAVAARLRDEGVTIRTGVRAETVRRGGAGRKVTLSDGSVVEAAEVVVAVGRRPASLKELGVEEAGVGLDDRGTVSPDEHLRVAPDVFVAGDVAGGLQFTHVADHEGRIAARNALGADARADLLAIPRTTFTDPETAAVGRTVEEARAAGIDAFEVTQDFSTTARGYTIEPRDHRTPPVLEGTGGHISVVVDRESRTLVGAFAACPGASELIGEAVLAVKLRVPIDVVADAIHPFPTATRVFGNVIADAAKRLR